MPPAAAAPLVNSTNPVNRSNISSETAVSAANAATGNNVGSAAAVNHAWEATSGQAMWEYAVQEDADGNIVTAHAGETIADLLRQRRKRQEQTDYSQRHRRVVRDMIRYLYIVLDASRWMRSKDPVLPPSSRIGVTIQLLQTFITEYYDQNPLSHLGFVVVQDGEAEILSPLSSNSKAHQLALNALAQMAAGQPMQAGGEFSLQNGLMVAGRSLGHQPRHGSREIVVLTAALSTCDPGSILVETLPKLVQARIRVSTFALSAEMHICRQLADRTHGTMGVCLDKPHFSSWLVQQTVPPPSIRRDGIDNNDSSDYSHSVCDLVPMGFPTRTTADVPALVHATRTKTVLARTAYTCPQCQANHSTLPTDCAVCNLKLVLAPHLARSFHHLFPVASFIEVPPEPSSLSTTNIIENASSNNSVTSSKMIPKITSSISNQSIHGENTNIKLNSDLLVSSQDDTYCCYACLQPMGISTINNEANANFLNEQIIRYKCPDCGNLFCVNCDTYLHETLHNCPGCLTN